MTNKSDLISRKALKKKLQARHDNGEEDFDKGYNIGIETAIDLIDNAPTVEAFTENDKALAYCEGYVRGSNEAYVRPQGEPVIKCQDCKYRVKKWQKDNRMKEKGYWAYGCKHFGEIMGYWGFGGNDNEFCSDAEQKEGTENDT